MSPVETLTVDGQVNPGTVGTGVVALVEEENRALVPPLVRCSDVTDLNRSLTSDQPYPTAVGGVHAWRISVEQDEDRRVEALLAPGDDVLDVVVVWVADLTLEDPAAADVGRLTHRSTALRHDRLFVLCKSIYVRIVSHLETCIAPLTAAKAPREEQVLCAERDVGRDIESKVTRREELRAFHREGPMSTKDLV